MTENTESIVAATKYHISTRVTMVVFCFSVILVSLLSFGYNAILRGLEIPHDFCYFYTAGQLWSEGEDIYARELFHARLIQLGERALGGFATTAYPPQGYALFSLLARWPVETAHQIFLSVNLLLLVVALGMFAYILSQYQPIGLLEVTLLVSLLNTGFSRGNIRDGQVGLVVCVALLGTFLLVIRKREAWAGLVLSTVSFKPTFLPLYVGYYLLRRSYRLVVMCALSVAILTILPLLLTQRPLLKTMEAWLQALTFLQNKDTINNPSPFTPYSAALLNIAPLVFRTLNAQSSVTIALSWLIVLILWGYTAYLVLHSGSLDREPLLDFGLVSALSLLSIYHRSYDIFLLFPGLLYLYVYAVKTREQITRRRWAGFLIIVILLISLPNDLSTRISNVCPALLDHYLWRVVAPFQAWASVAVLIALLWLKARQLASEEAQSR